MFWNFGSLFTPTSHETALNEILTKANKGNQNKRKRSNLGYIFDHFLIQEFEFNYTDEEVV